MASIKVLPENLISQIAAGEVVERPSSVIKELVENSIDAGATHIMIEVEQGGSKLIMVRDDGSGMDDEDAKMAFARHATSKISSLDDLDRIASFGFRGEALAAIASVSFVTLKTRLSQNENGVEIVCNGGSFKSQGPCAAMPGTEIVVRSLFFNTPARKKFLKAENTELAHVVATVSHIALAYPELGFELKHNGKTVLSVPKNQKAEDRVRDILGKSFGEDMVPVLFETPSIKIHGFVGRPGAALSSKHHQYLFVNGRDVGDPVVSRAVCDGYGSRLPARCFPLYLLHVDIDPTEVDVNVHPRKMSVKFLDTQRVYRDVRQAIEQALDLHQQKLFVGISQSPTLSTPQSTQEGMDFSTPTKNPEGLVRPTDAAPVPPTFHLISQVADSYLLIMEESGLAIVDQHAAHERIMYEKFKRQAEQKEVTKQQLLVPLSLECSREELLFLEKALPFLEKLGFEFEAWSGGTFVMQACPTGLDTENLKVIFKNVMQQVMQEGGSEAMPERVLKSLACKAAVKFGMKLSLPEQQKLLDELTLTPNNATCPHGRPTKVLVSFEELERRFYRRK